LVREIERVESYRIKRDDDVFICCAGFEERCFGSFNRFKNFTPRNSFIISYERDAIGSKYAKTMHSMLKGSKSILTSGKDPVNSFAALAADIRKLGLNPRDSVITIDVTVLTKRHILLLLRMLDDMELFNSIRVLYTEPRNYSTELFLPMSSGLRQIDVVPGFVNVQPLGRPLMLVVLLGYEGDRAMALFNELDPNETMMIVPRPAYHAEWEGRTQQMNSTLINLLGEEKIRFVDSRDPYLVSDELERILIGNTRLSLSNLNCCISPLGTKPQTIGLYLFWRKHRFEFSIVYAEPLKYNQRFYSTGIGTTWSLVEPNQV
jgi:hypothetical protein